MKLSIIFIYSLGGFMKNLTSTVAIINQALKTRNAVCIIKKTKSSKSLLLSLWEHGLLSSIQSQKYYWVVTIKSKLIDTRTSSEWQLKAISKGSKTVTIKARTLRTYSKKNRRNHFVITSAASGCITTLKTMTTSGTILASISSK